MYFGLIVPAYSSYPSLSNTPTDFTKSDPLGYAFFAPSIIKSYGYDCMSSQAVLTSKVLC